MSDRARGKVLLSGESREKAGHYVEALKVGGLDPDRVLPLAPEDGPFDAEELRSLAAEADGVLVCGGPDVAPERYGEERRADANLRIVESLDALELELLAGADEGATPVLGVCRGQQLLNVYLGGSLHQDLPSELEEPLTHRLSEPLHALAHEVRVTNHSTEIGRLYGSDPIPVNSRHHQAVKRLGRDLVAVGHSDDGVLEIVQADDDRWWRWAVQWHPENLISHEVHRRLWRAFVGRVTVERVGGERVSVERVSVPGVSVDVGTSAQPGTEERPAERESAEAERVPVASR